MLHKVLIYKLWFRHKVQEQNQRCCIQLGYITSQNYSNWVRGLRSVEHTENYILLNYFTRVLYK